MKSKKQINTDIKKACTVLLTSAANIALVLVIFAAITGVIYFTNPFIGRWFLNQNLENAANLTTSQSSEKYNFVNITSSLVMASVTTIYVLYTGLILKATNESTQQTANAQKIAYLERKLEKFYMPMQSALKRFDYDKMEKLIESPDMNVKQHVPRMYYKMNAVWWDFKSDYNNVVPFTYLASNEVQDVLTNFTNIFDSNKVFLKQYPQYVVFDKIISGEIESSLTEENSAKFTNSTNNISAYYQELSSMIDNSVRSLRAELAKLVNQ